MLTKIEANRIRGLVARKVRCERALWALNSDNANGVDFGDAYRQQVIANLKAADEALFGLIRQVTGPESGLPE